MEDKRGAPFPVRPVALVSSWGRVLLLFRAAGLAVRAGLRRLFVCAAADADGENCRDDDDDVFHVFVLGLVVLLRRFLPRQRRGVFRAFVEKARREGAFVGDGTKAELLPEQKRTVDYREKAARMGGQMSVGGCSTTQNLSWGWWMRVTEDLEVRAIS